MRRGPRRVVMTRRLTPTIPATRKASKHSDFSGCTTWAVKGKDLFLDDRQAASDVGAPGCWVSARSDRSRPPEWVGCAARSGTAHRRRLSLGAISAP